MFSHLAEESSRLSHAFIGALFSVIIVFSPQNMLGIIILCIGLYAIFIMNTITLHFMVKAIFEANVKYSILMLIWYIVSILSFIAISVGYTFKPISPEWLTLTDDARKQIVVGLVVFALFMLAVNISHMNSCYIHNKESKQ